MSQSGSPVAQNVKTACLTLIFVAIFVLFQWMICVGNHSTCYQEVRVRLTITVTVMVRCQLYTTRFKIQDSRFKIQDSRFKIQDSRFISNFTTRFHETILNRMWIYRTHTILGLGLGLGLGLSWTECGSIEPTRSSIWKKNKSLFWDCRSRSRSRFWESIDRLNPAKQIWPLESRDFKSRLRRRSQTRPV